MLAAQPEEDLLGRVLQVVGALVIDHQRQNKPRPHTIHILSKAPTLILTAIRVKPVGVRGVGKRGTQETNRIVIVSSNNVSYY